MHLDAVHERRHQFINLQSIRFFQKNLEKWDNIFELVVKKCCWFYLVDSLKNFAQNGLNLWSEGKK